MCIGSVFLINHCPFTAFFATFTSFTITESQSTFSIVDVFHLYLPDITITGSHFLNFFIISN